MTELSSVELGISLLSACVPACRPLYNYIFHGKATANSPSHHSSGNSGAVKMARMAHGKSGGHRDPNGNSEDDVERLFQNVPLGTTTNVQGLEEHGHEFHEGILVTREFAALDNK